MSVSLLLSGLLSVTALCNMFFCYLCFTLLYCNNGKLLLVILKGFVLYIWLLELRTLSKAYAIFLNTG